MNLFFKLLAQTKLKYYLILFVITFALVFYFFFVIMSYIWPFLLILLVGSIVYLYFKGKDNNITYYK